MTKTLIKSRYKTKQSISPEIKPSEIKTSTSLSPELQAFKDKILSGNGFLVYK